MLKPRVGVMFRLVDRHMPGVCFGVLSARVVDVRSRYGRRPRAVTNMLGSYASESPDAHIEGLGHGDV